jgi:tubulin---tyrosine ligase
LGAAFVSSLSGTRAIALSYGNMYQPIPPTYHEPAFKLSSKIINHLIDNWGPRKNKVLYSINIPMIEKLLHEDGLKIYWTSVWMAEYERLFVKVPDLAEKNTIKTTDATVPHGGGESSRDVAKEENLLFAFDPDLSGILSLTAAPEGTDSWALNVGAASVTPYLTCFAQLPESECSFPCLQDREWKL